MGKGRSKRSSGGKFAYVMKEFSHGKLHSGSKHGPIVRHLDQAKAIAAAEAGRARAIRATAHHHQHPHHVLHVHHPQFH